LKYNYPAFILALILGAALYVSLKHEPSLPRDTVSATDEERQDQLNLSAMHAEPAPAQVPAPAAGAQHASANPADLSKLHVLQQILAAHGDNDPRLDSELKNLSPGAKALMRGQYEATQTEKRNQRGTIVYLVGRELNSSEDVGFLHSVLSEAPCLSLTDCTREERASVLPEEHHLDAGNDTTLAYPQIVALKSIEAFLNRPESASNALSPQLVSELEAARQSPVRKVATLADEIARRYAQKRR
jgi:hypothetical protein